MTVDTNLGVGPHGGPRPGGGFTGGVRSVATALRIFEVIARRQPIGLSALARELDVPKSTVQRGLVTLADRRWIVQDLLGQGRWSVSARLAVLAEPEPILQTARALARPLLPGLRDRTGGPAALFTIDGDRMGMLDGYEGIVADLESQRGPLPIHASGAGRAMLAALPVARQRQIVARLEEQGLTAYTPRTVTDGAALLAAIVEARRDGCAIVVDEYLPRVATVGAAITGSDGLPIAAVAAIVTAPSPTPAELRAVGREVAAVATTVSRQLTAS